MNAVIPGLGNDESNAKTPPAIAGAGTGRGSGTTMVFTKFGAMRTDRRTPGCYTRPAADAVE